MILADTMATFIKPPTGSAQILPTTPLRAVNAATSSVKLVRKLNIIGDAAVAFAGNGEVSLSFSRISKAVRMTVALDKKLHEAPASVSTGSAAAIEQRVRAELCAQEAAEAPVIARDIGRKLWRMAGKPMIRYAIELAIETEHEREERERLLPELDARLEAEDSEDQRLYGPGQYQELLQRICRDLGLAAVRLGWDFYWNQPAYAPVDADDLAAGP